MRDPRTRAKPGQGPIASFVGIHHRNVSIVRGSRFVHHHGRWRRVVAVTALTGVTAIVVVGGANYYADGYVDLAGPTCGGITDNGCQLNMTDVPTNDGGTVPQCVQYCPWDTASDETTAPESAAAVEPAPEPVGSVTTEPTSLRSSRPDAVQSPAQDYAISIQSAPDAGGKCIDVPNRQVTPGAPLQIWPCNGTSAQTFSYEAISKRLMIGGLCVDMSGAVGKSGAPLQLAPCNGRPTQTWYIRQNGSYVEFVGIDGLCMDIMNGSTQDQTPLIAATCHGQPNQSWTMHAAAQAAAR